MAFQADGSAVVNLANPIVLPSATAWTWTMRLQKSSDSEMVAGEGGNSRPFIGFFNGGVPSVRFDSAVSGTATFSLSGTYTVGQYYDFVLSHDGAGTITFSVGAASATLPQNANITIDVFLDYGSFTIPYSGITEGNWVFTGAVGGDRSYNWDQTNGSTVLVEDLQGLNENITGITTGGFIGSPAGDTTIPVITLLGAASTTVTQGDAYNDAGATASDDTDGDITVNIVTVNPVDVNTLGNYTVTYNVSDAAGNAATQVTRAVEVVSAGAGDTTAPVITLVGDNPLTLAQGTPYSEPGFSATDNIDGDITGSVVTAGTVDENTVGQYAITYNVSDAAGNAATQITRTVDVVVPTAGVITVSSLSSFNGKLWDANQQAQFTLTGTITDGTGPVQVSVGGGAFVTLDAGTGTTFSGSVTVTGQQDIVLRLSNDNTVTETLEKITAGVVIIDGPSQSNGAGRGTNLQAPTFDPTKPTPIMWKQTDGFNALTDPTGIDSSSAGSMWPHIAKQYSDLGIPVIICNVGQGGSRIDQWQPGGSYYGRIINAANAAGGASFVTSIIGETDSDLGTTTATFKAGYKAIADQLAIDLDVDLYATYFPVGDTTGAGYPEIRTAYDELIAENARIKNGGDMAIININVATATGNDGLHIIQDADLIQAAGIRFTEFPKDFTVLPSSTFSIAVDGVPDGDYEVVYFNVPAVGDINLTSPAGVATATALNGQFSMITTLEAGSEIVGLAPGDNPPTTGTAVYGVTS